ncbi:hypothetical protein BC831DRAFT_463092 [Entophlyctis helioformis]|nr:hypothetical protein BC831DRAFT_463092 [Entophlyctis helioformis]
MPPPPSTPHSAQQPPQQPPQPPQRRVSFLTRSEPAHQHQHQHPHQCMNHLQSSANASYDKRQSQHHQQHHQQHLMRNQLAYRRHSLYEQQLPHSQYACPFQYKLPLPSTLGQLSTNYAMYSYVSVQPHSLPGYPYGMASPLSPPAPMSSSSSSSSSGAGSVARITPGNRRRGSDGAISIASIGMGMGKGVGMGLGNSSTSSSSIGDTDLAGSGSSHRGSSATVRQSSAASLSANSTANNASEMHSGMMHSSHRPAAARTSTSLADLWKGRDGSAATIDAENAIEVAPAVADEPSADHRPDRDRTPRPSRCLLQHLQIPKRCSSPTAADSPLMANSAFATPSDASHSAHSSPASPLATSTPASASAATASATASAQPAPTAMAAPDASQGSPSLQPGPRTGQGSPQAVTAVARPRTRARRVGSNALVRQIQKQYRALCRSLFPNSRSHGPLSPSSLQPQCTAHLELQLLQISHMERTGQLEKELSRLISDCEAQFTALQMDRIMQELKTVELRNLSLQVHMEQGIVHAASSFPLYPSASPARLAKTTSVGSNLNDIASGGLAASDLSSSQAIDPASFSLPSYGQIVFAMTEVPLVDSSEVVARYEAHAREIEQVMIYIKSMKLSMRSTKAFGSGSLFEHPSCSNTSLCPTLYARHAPQLARATEEHLMEFIRQVSVFKQVTLNTQHYRALLSHLRDRERTLQQSFSRRVRVQPSQFRRVLADAQALCFKIFSPSLVDPCSDLATHKVAVAVRITSSSLSSSSGVSVAASTASILPSELVLPVKGPSALVSSPRNGSPSTSPPSSTSPSFAVYSSADSFSVPQSGVALSVLTSSPQPSNRHHQDQYQYQYQHQHQHQHQPQQPQQFSFTVQGMLSYSTTAEVITLDRLCVHPRYRNQGIATSLLNTVETEAMDAGHARVEVESIKSAVRFYRSRGYRSFTPERGSQRLSSVFGIRNPLTLRSNSTGSNGHGSNPLSPAGIVQSASPRSATDARAANGSHSRASSDSSIADNTTTIYNAESRRGSTMTAAGFASLPSATTAGNSNSSSTSTSSVGSWMFKIVDSYSLACVPERPSISGTTGTSLASPLTAGTTRRNSELHPAGTGLYGTSDASLGLDEDDPDSPDLKRYKKAAADSNLASAIAQRLRSWRKAMDADTSVLAFPDPVAVPAACADDDVPVAAPVANKTRQMLVSAAAKTPNTKRHYKHGRSSSLQPPPRQQKRGFKRLLTAHHRGRTSSSHGDSDDEGQDSDGSDGDSRQGSRYHVFDRQRRLQSSRSLESFSGQ